MDKTLKHRQKQHQNSSSSIRLQNWGEQKAFVFFQAFYCFLSPASVWNAGLKDQLVVPVALYWALSSVQPTTTFGLNKGPMIDGSQPFYGLDCY